MDESLKREIEELAEQAPSWKRGAIPHAKIADLCERFFQETEGTVTKKLADFGKFFGNGFGWAQDYYNFNRLPKEVRERFIDGERLRIGVAKAASLAYHPDKEWIIRMGASAKTDDEFCIFVRSSLRFRSNKEKVGSRGSQTAQPTNPSETIRPIRTIASLVVKTKPPPMDEEEPYLGPDDYPTLNGYRPARSKEERPFEQPLKWNGPSRVIERKGRY